MKSALDSDARLSRSLCSFDSESRFAALRDALISFSMLAMLFGLHVFDFDFDVFMSSLDDILVDVCFVDFIVVETVLFLQDVSEGFAGVVEVAKLV